MFATFASIEITSAMLISCEWWGITDLSDELQEPRFAPVKSSYSLRHLYETSSEVPISFSELEIDYWKCWKIHYEYLAYIEKSRIYHEEFSLHQLLKYHSFFFIHTLEDWDFEKKVKELPTMFNKSDRYITVFPWNNVELQSNI